jgi:hypothetical protein
MILEIEAGMHPPLGHGAVGHSYRHEMPFRD